MKRVAFSLVSFCFLLMLSVSNAFSDGCSTCDSGCTSPPSSSSSSPGGGHPDETFAVDSGFFRDGSPPLSSDPSAVTFQNGYAKEFSNFLDAFRKVEVKTDTA